MKINGIADLRGSRVLIGIQIIKCVFSCCLNWHKVESSPILIGISFQTFRPELENPSLENSRKIVLRNLKISAELLEYWDHRWNLFQRFSEQGLFTILYAITARSKDDKLLSMKEMI